MKKIFFLSLCIATTLCSGGFAVAQSMPALNANMTTLNISQPYAQSDCKEPNGDIVYNVKQLYLGDSYTTRDFVPVRGNGYDTLILDSSKVLVYHPTLFNFSSPITWKSNGVPNGLSAYAVVSAIGTFQTNATGHAQLIYNIYRTALYNGGSSSYTISYLPNSNGATTQTTTLQNKTFYNQAGWVVHGFECVDYTVHYCGDGIVDTQASIAALPGGITNSIANEQCDGTAGVPSGYTCNSSCKLVQTIVQPHCSLTPTQQTISCGGNAMLSFVTTNTNSISNLVNIPSGTVAINGGSSLNVTPTLTTTYSFTANGMPGSTPAICSGTVIVNPAAQPNCSLTPASQTITAGQNAMLTFVTTFTNSISNLVNIPSGTVAINGSSSLNVTPTTTTTYSFTVNGGACTLPKTCSGTVIVTPALQPHLWINKTLINNVAYHSGDLVGWRIDFKNIGAGIAHHVILTDYLPASLQYISSQLFGIIPPYNLGVGMLGINPEIIYSGFDLAPGQAGYMIITGQLISYELCDKTMNTSFIESAEVIPALHSEAIFFCYSPTTNLTIDKTINKQIFYPGEYISFAIAVTNNGPDVAQSVKIGDIRPNPSCILSTGGRSSNMPLTLTNPTNPYERTLNTTLPVGQTVHIYLTGQVANTRSCAGNYVNTGTLTYVVNNVTKQGWDIVNFSVPMVNVSFTKSLLQHGTTHGDAVVYSLDYANNGTDTLTSYDVTDYWPGTLTFTTATPMPQTQITVPGGQILKWHFTTPLAPGGTGKIMLNGIIN